MPTKPTKAEIWNLRLGVGVDLSMARKAPRIGGGGVEAGSIRSMDRRRAQLVVARRRIGSHLGLSLLGSLLACTAAAPTPPPPDAAEVQACPDDQQPEHRAPDVADRHLEAAFWLDRMGASVDEPLLEDAGIVRLNRAVLDVPGAWRDIRDDALATDDAVTQELEDRMQWLTGKIDSGDYVEGEPGAIAGASKSIREAEPIDEYRLMLSESQLFCIPTRKPIFTPPKDPEFNRNHCASLHPGEPVRVLRASEEWKYVRSSHSVGWLAAPRWTAPLEGRALAVEAHGARVVTKDHAATGLRMGTFLPIDPGPEELRATGEVTHRGPLPFTRRNLLELAFAQLDAPYGWGGREGGRDCSRFLYDLFASFGIHLGRHSAVQSKLGTASVDVSDLDEDQKRARVRESARTGAVLLYMPGHIMMYLGHDGDHDYAISSLSEFLTPCAGGNDTVHRLDKVTVTTLDVGRGSERTAFIERISRIAVFGSAS